jgi:hypothetical protein
MFLSPGIWQIHCHDADLIAELFGEKQATTLLFQVKPEEIPTPDLSLESQESSVLPDPCLSTPPSQASQPAREVQRSVSGSTAQLKCALLSDHLEGIPGEVLILRGQVSASGELDVQVFQDGRLMFQGKREVQFPPNTRMGVFGIPIPLPAAPWSGELTGKVTLRGHQESAQVTFSITCLAFKSEALFERSAEEDLLVKKLQKLVPVSAKNPPVRQKVQRQARIAPFSLETFEQRQNEAEKEPILNSGLQNIHDGSLTPDTSLENRELLPEGEVSLSAELSLVSDLDPLPPLNPDLDPSPSQDLVSSVEVETSEVETSLSAELSLVSDLDSLPPLNSDLDPSPSQDPVSSVEVETSEVETSLSPELDPLPLLNPDLYPSSLQDPSLTLDPLVQDESESSLSLEDFSRDNIQINSQTLAEDSLVDSKTLLPTDPSPDALMFTPEPLAPSSVGDTKIPLPDVGSHSPPQESSLLGMGVPLLPVPRSFSLSPLRGSIQPLTPSTPLPEPSIESELPSPSITLPERLRAGDNIDVVLQVPCLVETDTSPARPFWIKLWVKNAQTRSIVDGPRWILDFAKTDHGEWQSLTRMTIPHGIAELIFEAWVISRDLQQQGSRTTLRRLIQ